MITHLSQGRERLNTFFFFISSRQQMVNDKKNLAVRRSIWTLIAIPRKTEHLFQRKINENLDKVANKIFVVKDIFTCHNN